ncbi:16S rRNA (guanine(1207)-N(2))-methyltransferase RsmC [Rosenbergiella australiborealis]|uniref:16S rRNA (guanine(1207)-N(2))-methyltransferase RsmC n=1 Tax=Rosenbergiella australiborealis TaxID=1544696 RepID=UPI001F4EA93A|nr:16S rRNA (guanine(1207)-N(2))-methyltransferase RsmC [Rosenbergiella australiborealis]
MSAYMPASEVLLRHEEEFEHRHIIFAGDLQDMLPAQLTTASTRVFTQQYHHWQALSKPLEERAHFGLYATAEHVAGCDTLIYYWPKNKPEAAFQLENLLALLPVGSDLFIVGENRSGVRSAEIVLEKYSKLEKIDSARRCGLYHGRLDQHPDFNLDSYYNEYPLDNLTIKTLPGVFSRDGLDNGSALLLSTLTPHTKGKVLDLGCGAGVLAASLKQHSPKVRLWLTDVNAAAIAASQATLAINNIEGDVFASNVFSNVQGRFDMILSNPPFHEGLQTSLEAANALIRGAANHLSSGGELRIVANAFLPYPQALEETFGNYEILAQTGKFRVYRSIWGRNKR